MTGPEPFYNITGYDAETDWYDYVRTAPTLEEAEAIAKRLVAPDPYGTAAWGPRGGKRYDRVTVADSEGHIKCAFTREV